MRNTLQRLVTYRFDVEEKYFFVERWYLCQEGVSAPVHADISDNNRPYWSRGQETQPRHFFQLYRKRKFVQHTTQKLWLYFWTKQIRHKIYCQKLH